jgi:hypothetical protein
LFLRGPVLHPPPALRMVKQRLSNPDVAVVPVLAPGGEPPIETTAVPRSPGRIRCFPGSMRRDAFMVAVRLCFCQIACLQRQIAGEIRNRRGRVYPIARRFASTVCLVVYKDRQFEVNYMQSAAKQQLPEKSRFTENCQASAA